MTDNTPLDVDELDNIVDSFSVHTPRGRAKGTLARRNLKNRLRKHINWRVQQELNKSAASRKKYELEARIDERNKLQFHWEESYDNVKGRYYKKIDSDLHDKRIATLKQELKKYE